MSQAAPLQAPSSQPPAAAQKTSFATRSTAARTPTAPSQRCACQYPPGAAWWVPPAAPLSTPEATPTPAQPKVHSAMKPASPMTTIQRYTAACHLPPIACLLPPASAALEVAPTGPSWVSTDPSLATKAHPRGERLPPVPCRRTTSTRPTRTACLWRPLAPATHSQLRSAARPEGRAVRWGPLRPWPARPADRPARQASTAPICWIATQWRTPYASLSRPTAACWGEQGPRYMLRSPQAAWGKVFCRRGSYILTALPSANSPILAEPAGTNAVPPKCGSLPT